MRRPIESPRSGDQRTATQVAEHVVESTDMDRVEARVPRAVHVRQRIVVVHDVACVLAAPGDGMREARFVRLDQADAMRGQRDIEEPFEAAEACPVDRVRVREAADSVRTSQRGQQVERAGRKAFRPFAERRDEGVGRAAQPPVGDEVVGERVGVGPSQLERADTRRSEPARLQRVQGDRLRQPRDDLVEAGVLDENAAEVEEDETRQTMPIGTPRRARYSVSRKPSTNAPGNRLLPVPRDP